MTRHVRAFIVRACCAILGLALAVVESHIHVRLEGRTQTDRRLPPTERRLALVVGNDDYTGAPLRNARNDARAMARALEGLGFSVTRLEDATRSTLGQALEQFGNRLTAG